MKIIQQFTYSLFHCDQLEVNGQVYKDN